jgi:hypothetical protein
MKLIPKSRTFERAPLCQYIKRHIERQSPCVRAVLARDTYIFLLHFEMNKEWNNLRHLYVLLIFHFQYSLSYPGNKVSVSKCMIRPHSQKFPARHLPFHKQYWTASAVGTVSQRKYKAGDSRLLRYNVVSMLNNNRRGGEGLFKGQYTLWMCVCVCV